MSPSGKLRARAFTIVEVMMAATIILIGVIGMIEAIALTSSTIAHSRRQVLASEIMNQEIEELRRADWSVIAGLPVAATPIPIDRQFWPPWSPAASYVVNSAISYNGGWYRCIAAHSNIVPTDTSCWTPAAASATSDIVMFAGANYTLTRSLTSPDPVTDIREVNFIVTWVVPTSRKQDDGTPLIFTYQRNNSAWFGKSGLNLSFQRS